MITINSIEINRDSCINSIVRARALDGSRKDVRITQHEGNVAFFTDTRMVKYKLPENIKLKVFTRLDKLVPSDHIVELTLKHIWENWGTEEVVIENYLGNREKISIQGISKEKYGWLSPHDFTFQEGNLVISPNDEKPILIEKIEEPALIEESYQIVDEIEEPPILIGEEE